MPQIMNSLKEMVDFRATRFVTVGLLNTAVNFTILNLAFYSLHQAKLVSSFIATGCAVIFSFILNRYFVFRHRGHIGKQMARFILITAVGVLLIQNLLYALGLYLLHKHEYGIINLVDNLTTIKVGSAFVDVNLSNIMASLGVMVWNYNGYRLHVFKSEGRRNDIVET